MTESQYTLEQHLSILKKSWKEATRYLEDPPEVTIEPHPLNHVRIHRHNEFMIQLEKITDKLMDSKNPDEFFRLLYSLLEETLDECDTYCWTEEQVLYSTTRLLREFSLETFAVMRGAIR